MKNVPKEYAEIYERLGDDYKSLLKLILSEKDDMYANEFLGNYIHN